MKAKRAVNLIRYAYEELKKIDEDIMNGVTVEPDLLEGLFDFIQDYNDELKQRKAKPVYCCEKMENAVKQGNIPIRPIVTGFTLLRCPWCGSLLN